MLILPLTGSAQRQNATYLDYIARYRAVALQHQAEFGIPASITLAQGLLESRAGQSYLATRGNNHFGIKCHNNWHGEAVEYDDTLRHACYRKYGCAEDSYLDHAHFLLGRRYSRLYQLGVDDYRGWAQGLRDCGYAEDPNYPRKLVAIIEQYHLHELADSLPPAQELPQTAHQSVAQIDAKVAEEAQKEQGASSPDAVATPQPPRRPTSPDPKGSASPDND